VSEDVSDQAEATSIATVHTGPELFPGYLTHSEPSKSCVICHLWQGILANNLFDISKMDSLNE
jgi:hypothetical protein